MRRIDLPEIEDSPACPAWLRDAMTGYLQTVTERVEPYAATLPVLRELLGSGSGTRILDLASGSGGPWPGLIDQLEDVHVTLSDIAPPRDAVGRFQDHARLQYRPTPVSALNPPNGDFEAWTIFTGLHHFGPDDVMRIMREAQHRGVRFAAFEATSRSAAGVGVTLLIPVLVLAMMPRVRPKKVVPLLLTYLPPILPFLIWWDGFASTLRSYTAAELMDFANQVGDGAYRWSVEELRSPSAPIPVLTLVGRPHRVVA